MTTKHTPGPWICGHYSSVVGCPIMAQPDTAKNAIIVAGTISAAATDPAKFRAECEANARLIAAAPEMLEALKGAIGALEFCRDYHSDLGNEDQDFAQVKLEAAIAAISKAEART